MLLVLVLGAPAFGAGASLLPSGMALLSPGCCGPNSEDREDAEQETPEITRACCCKPKNISGQPTPPVFLLEDRSEDEVEAQAFASAGDFRWRFRPAFQGVDVDARGPPPLPTTSARSLYAQRVLLLI